MLSGECLFAFLDDVFAISLPERARTIHDLLGEKLSEGAEIRRAGECLPDMEELGPEVWSPQGMNIPGTTVGTEAFEERVRVLNGSKKKTSCGTSSIGSQICSALSRSWCSAPV